MAGKLPPTIVKPAPVTAAEFIVTGAVPVEVNVSGCVVAVSIVTLPKLKPAALSVRCGLDAAAPVPLRATTAVAPFTELLLIVICPLAIPVAVGLNCTCRVIDCVGFNVAGKLPPMIAKPAPLIAIESTVTGAVPVDVSVNDCVVAASIVIFPKLRLAALTVNRGLAVGFTRVVPVPVKATNVVLPVDALLLIVICPLAGPAATGSNRTCSAADCPGFNVTGKPLPITVYPVPVIAAESTVTGNVPVDVSVKDCVVAVLIATLPKLRLVALTVSCEVP